MRHKKTNPTESSHFTPEINKEREEILQNTEVSQQKDFPSIQLLFPFVSLFQIQHTKSCRAVSTCAMSMTMGKHSEWKVAKMK